MGGVSLAVTALKKDLGASLLDGNRHYYPSSCERRLTVAARQRHVLRVRCSIGGCSRVDAGGHNPSDVVAYIYGQETAIIAASRTIAEHGRIWRLRLLRLNAPTVVGVLYCRTRPDVVGVVRIGGVRFDFIQQHTFLIEI